MLGLAELLGHAARHPLYAAWELAGVTRFGTPRWRTLPTLERHDLRRCGVMDGQPRESEELLFFSSGTTGEPNLIRYGADDFARIGELCRRFTRFEGLGHHSRVMVLLPMALWGVGKITVEGHRRAGAQVFPVDLHGGVDLWQRAAEQIRPTVISSTPSVLAAWAPDYRGPPLELVETTGELLLDRERRRIEGCFGAFVQDAYGLSECVVGVECRLRHGFHYWPDAVGVEILAPGSSHPVNDGAPGEIVVTSFMQARMPILRFRTGDRGRLSRNRCLCGSDLPLLLLEGRLGDDFELPRAVTLRREELEAALAELGLVGQARWKGRPGSPAEPFVTERFEPTLELSLQGGMALDSDSIRHHLLAALPEVAELVHEGELVLTVA